MTVKLSISVPDDVAAWLAAQRNTSAVVTDVVRQRMSQDYERRGRLRQAAVEFAAWQRDEDDPGYMDEADRVTHTVSAGQE